MQCYVPPLSLAGFSNFHHRRLGRYFKLVIWYISWHALSGSHELGMHFCCQWLTEHIFQYMMFTQYFYTTVALWWLYSDMLLSSLADLDIMRSCVSHFVVFQQTPSVWAVILEMLARGSMKFSLSGLWGWPYPSPITLPATNFCILLILSGYKFLLRRWNVAVWF